jgi:hypothetical protein
MTASPCNSECKQELEGPILSKNTEAIRQYTEDFGTLNHIALNLYKMHTPTQPTP